jgi:DnaJ-domain-containing protein 1
MDRNSLIVGYLLDWLGILVCLAGLVIWWGAFKIPAEHVGMTRNKKLYAAGWHFHILGRFMRMVLVDLPGLEKRVSDEVRSNIKDRLDSIESVAGEMGFSFQVSIGATIRNFIDGNKEGLLLGTADMGPLLANITKLADADLSNLRVAKASHEKALAAYEIAAKEIHNSGSGSLLRSLDRAHDGLFSTNWEQLLQKRLWLDFNDIMRGAELELQEMKRLASSSQQTKEEPAPVSGMSTDHALRVLGLQDGANADQIKKAYRDAVKKYNVDQRQSLEDHIRNLVEEKFKEINAAYRILNAR